MIGNIKRVIPMLDYVLVQRAKKDLVTKGGIVLNEKQAGQSVVAKIIALGPGERHPLTGRYLPIQMKEGDDVLLPEEGGERIEIEDNDQEYLLFHESEILAKLEIQK